MMKDKIDYKEIKKLIDFMEEKNLSQFELEVEGFKIKFCKNQQPVLPTGSVQQLLSSPPDEVGTWSTYALLHC